MRVFRIYGVKENDKNQEGEKLLFMALYESCFETALKTAKSHNYKITKIINVTNFNDNSDVTSEFINKI